METEKKVVDYVVGAAYEDMPRKAIALMKAIILNALGAFICLPGAHLPAIMRSMLFAVVFEFRLG